jgi:hypothetical protein
MCHELRFTYWGCARRTSRHSTHDAHEETTPHAAKSPGNMQVDGKSHDVTRRRRRQDNDRSLGRARTRASRSSGKFAYTVAQASLVALCAALLILDTDIRVFL